MNCHGFQSLLYEFVEGSLSRRRVLEAERHLARCAVCRDALSEHRQVSACLGEKFRQHTAGLTLGPYIQHRVLSAIHARQSSPDPAARHLPWWLRVSFPRAIAAWLLLAIAFLGLAYVAGLRNPNVAPHQSGGGGPVPLPSIDMAFCVPSYTFVRQASFVIDALTCESQTVKQTPGR